MQDETMEKDAISLKAVFSLLAKHWWIILLAGVLCAAILIVCTALFVDIKYQASVMMYINTSIGQTSIKLNDLSTARDLVATYCVILSSRDTLEQVKALKGLPYSCEQLNAMISASAVNNTEIFRVSVTSHNPEEARVIANTVASVLESEIPSTIKGSSVEIIENAVRPTRPVSRGFAKKGTIGFIAGIVLAACAVLVLDHLYDTVKNEDWLKDYYGEDIPVLASIPDLNSAKDAYRYGYYARSCAESGAAEHREGDVTDA